MTTESTFRIPPARLSGPLAAIVRAIARRTFGETVPDNLYVYWHNKPVMRAVMAFSSRSHKWRTLAPDLTSYAQLASAAVIGCNWCLDFGYFLAHNEGLELAKVREVPRWRESTVFTATERHVLEYAEAMTVTPPTVSDELVADLIDRLGTAAVVELTQVIALENMYSRFNSAAGLQSQGYSDVCELPMAVASEG